MCLIAIGYWIGAQEKLGLEIKMEESSECIKSVKIGLFLISVWGEGQS